MLIVALATLVVLGPLGNYLGEGVGILLEYLNIYASWLVPDAGRCFYAVDGHDGYALRIDSDRDQYVGVFRI